MKLRQAFKICNNVSTRNLIVRNGEGAIVITGIKGTPYNYGQFRKAVLRVVKAFKRQYRYGEIKREARHIP